MRNIALIAILGALGVLSRHLLENKLSQKLNFIPLGTLTANALGCLLAGLLYQFIAQKTSHQEMAAIALLAFCGGLTTFSGYALSSLNDLANGDYLRASVYLIGSPVLGMIFVLTGMKLHKIFF